MAPLPLKPEIKSFDPTYNFDYDEDYDQAFKNTVPEADAIDKNSKPINQKYLADMMINSEFLLPHKETQQMDKVICRTINDNGNIIGTFDENPVLNSLVYDVEFPDGAVKNYAENVIAENILSQVYSSGFYTQALDKIVLHMKLGNAVSTKDYYVTTKMGFFKIR